MTLYDIYVIKTGGIPLFAGCTATDYCKMHMGQHELISGFLSAMLSFSSESFKDSELETILYSDIMLNFKVDRENDLIFAFVYEKNMNLDDIKKDLETAAKLFVDAFSDSLNDAYVDQSTFLSYRDLLREKGIINSGLTDTMAMQKMNEEFEKRKPSIVAWLKKKFSVKS